MTNDQALQSLANLEQAIKEMKVAVKTNAGYATVGECERLAKAYQDLRTVIEVNNWENIPF